MNKAPYYIRQIIDIHTLPNPELSENTVEELKKEGMIERRGSEWITSARGRAYVEMLCATPLPVAAYIDPRAKN